MQNANTFGNFIHFNQCIVEKVSVSTSSLIYLFLLHHHHLEERHVQHQVTFTKCSFRYNKLYRLLTIIGGLKIKLAIEGCIFNFKYNEFQLI